MVRLAIARELHISKMAARKKRTTTVPQKFKESIATNEHSQSNSEFELNCFAVYILTVVQNIL